MHGKFEDFKTGFIGIELTMGRSEIDVLIDALKRLKDDENYHFHLRGDFSGESGIGDLMIARKGEESDNLTLEI